MSNGSVGATRKLNQSRLQLIIDQVKNGVPAYRAAMATGVTERTYFNWTKRGREVLKEFDDDLESVPSNHPQYDFAFFVAAIEKAEAEAESGLVLQIVKESKKNWTAAAWMLERRYPERYGRKDKLDANVNGNIGVSFAENVSEAWKRRTAKQEELEARRQADDAGTNNV